MPLPYPPKKGGHSLKRILFLLLALLSILPLAACGRGEEYAYDIFLTDFPTVRIPVIDNGMAVKGGAYLEMAINDLEGKEYGGEKTRVIMRHLFNEELKSFIPLCTNAICDHSSTDCFGTVYEGFCPSLIIGIYKDNIFSIRDAHNKNGQLEAVYYGLDGIKHETVSFTPELLGYDGEIFDKHFSSTASSYVIYGTQIYLSLFALATDVNLTIDELTSMNQDEFRYSYWVARYDLDKKKWEMVSTRPVTIPSNSFIINDATEDKFSFAYEESATAYTFDIETGETEVYDCAVILDELISRNKLPIGTEIFDIYPLRDYFCCYAGGKTSYCRISTKELIDPSELTIETESYSQKFHHNGVRYSIDPGFESFELVNTDSAERITVDIPGYAMTLFSETEKGLIFTYHLILPDGTLEPDCYTVKENYRDVTYFYPQKFLYVTKEDILDGTIDEPWFYDPETYSFVLQ